MKCLSLLIIFAPFYSIAQINDGARLTALGTSGIAVKDIWAIEKNQAGLAAIKEMVVAVNYEQRLINSGISTQSALFVVPYRTNVFALSFQRYGFSAYNQQKVAFAFAKAFAPDFSAGINFNYHQLRIVNYGSAGTLSVEAGLQYEAAEGLVFGAHVANPVNSGVQREINDVIPVTIAFGASWAISDKVLLTSEMEKRLKLNTDVKLGLEYQPIEWIALRGGLSAQPFRQFAGFGVSYNNIRVDAAVASEITIGYSSQIGISYAF